ncbi:MAG TPA: acyltransferase family protein [Ferrovibrio sp.]|uniref:acyltransferase family protein n=1 Tax=Ferrovibrio sp. TaxID=1917215 RepID=UPI002ED5315E
MGIAFCISKPAAAASAFVAQEKTAARRCDLDWLRIIAFGLLIFYHMGMFFVTWDWHVKSAHAGPAIEPLMLLTSPWRLSLLFLIAGAATRFMAEKTPSIALLRARSKRLLLPLILGMLVIVPPQTFLEITEKLGWDGGVLAFYRLYLTGYDGWHPNGHRLIVPTWNHLWFVAYLWVYTMTLLALRPWLHAASERGWMRMAAARLTAPGILLLMLPVLLAFRLGLRPRFPETHALLDDWYLHAEYFTLFLFGYAIARNGAVWQAIERLRWPALIVALGCYATIAWAMLRHVAVAGSLRDVVWTLDQWAWIVMLLGFARRRLDHDNAARRYLTDAVFPFYILHQTVIVTIGHALKPFGLTAAEEAGIIVAATVAACFAGYEIVRRSGPLRPFFGLKAA